VPRRLKRLVRRLALAVAGLLAACLVAEAALRLLTGQPFWPPFLPEPYVDNEVLYRTTPARLYELRPGVDEVVGRQRVHIRINAAGFRDDRNWTVPKPEGVRRVLVIGDSYTFAGKVPLEQTYPQRLESLLNARTASPRHEVLNLAVPGYNARQQRLNLEERGLGFEPDLVIVAFVLNDAVPAAQLVPLDARLPLAARRWLKRSALVPFLASSLKRLPAIVAGRPTKAGSEAADLVEGSPGWRTVQESLLGMKHAASRTGAELLVAIWPMMEGLESDYPFATQHALVSRFCDERGIPFFDLYPAFAGSPTRSLWVAGDDHHPNAVAQERAASALFEALVERGLAP
jgi:lysophospholipase L1-like esterase